MRKRLSSNCGRSKCDQLDLSPTVEAGFSNTFPTATSSAGSASRFAAEPAFAPADCSALFARPAGCADTIHHRQQITAAATTSARSDFPFCPTCEIDPAAVNRQ